ncbi:alpha/beta-hydrolase [Rozella allomycis CSF55]|uniref:Alpha/beta-hydrolase n=1 Tax=Rozella allomycis (strain CSF55) TaxID=988480 RepID=A0A4P9YGX4_ROZAC|nr:alpha/beta-hydrolase [Rozella allomycis CSF55]
MISSSIEKGFKDFLELGKKPRTFEAVRDEVIGIQKKYDSSPEKTSVTGGDLLHKDLVYRYASFSGFTYCDGNERVKRVSGFKADGKLFFTGNFELIAREEKDGYQSILKDKKDFMYQLTVSKENKEIVVAFRGSDNFENYISDINQDRYYHDEIFGDKRLSIENDSCKLPNDKSESFFLRNGFLRSLPANIMDEIDSRIHEVIKANPDFSVVITGHSLGGSLAYLYALHWKVKGNNLAALYTYGQPITGSLSFNDWAAECIGPEKYIRVVSSDDIVPWFSFHVLLKKIAHSSLVNEIFFPNPHDTAFRVCKGSLNSDCSYGISCGKKVWDNHSLYGGLTSTQALCLLGDGPNSSYSQFVEPSVSQKVVNGIKSGWQAVTSIFN